MRKVLFVNLFLAMMLLVCFSSTVFAKTAIVEKNDLKIYIDGKLDIYSISPITVEGKAFLPLDELLKNMGISTDAGQMVWNGTEKSVTIKNDSVKIGLKVDSKNLTVNDKPITLDAAPVMYKDKVFVPVSFISKSFGKNVNWDSKTNSIIIGKSPDSKIKQVIVSSTEEFVRELGSNKRILLKPGIYNLSSIKQNDSKDKKVTWVEVDDGKELNLNNISNLSIEGSVAAIAELKIQPRFAEIMNFTNCSNIILKNIKAGHTPSEYECNAGVLGFSKCSDITIEGAELYGCGSIGITASDSKRLNCTNTKINHCSLRAIQFVRCESMYFSGCKISDHEAYSNIVHMRMSKDIKFEQCEFSNNNYFEWGFFEVSDQSDLLIDNCKITNNSQNDGDTWKLYAYFFETIDVIGNCDSSIVVKNTDFTNNSCDYLYDNEDSVTFENCTQNGNSWME